MKVEFTSHATDQLEQIYDYVAADSVANAAILISRLIDRAESLAEQPWRGRRVPEFLRYDIREVREQPYRIIYRVGLDAVQILTVMHEKQLLPMQSPNHRK